MALTYSQMLPLGTKIPNFNLLNVVNDKFYSTENLDNEKNTLVMIICNHCPYVVHYHQEIKNLFNDYKNKKVSFIAISSNDVVNYPQDSPEKMKELFKHLDLSFPYLYDESQEVAKKFKAECTPEFYLFNSNKTLVYRGRLDSSSPGNSNQINGIDLRNAIDSTLKNKEVDKNQFPSMGCNIKWK